MEATTTVDPSAVAAPATTIAPAAPAAPASTQPADTAAPAAPAAPATPPAAQVPTDTATPAPAAPPAAPVSVDPVNAANYQSAGVIVPSHTDPRVNSVESLLAEKGITNEQAMLVFGKAIETMNFEMINQAGLEALVGKASATLIMSNLTSYNTDMQAQQAASLDYAHTKFGGKEQFDAAVNWMNSNLNHPSMAGEFAAIKQLCAMGGEQMKLGLETLQRRFAASGFANSTVIVPDSAAGGTPNVEPFNSRVEYAEAMRKAYYSNDKAQVAAVTARFAASPKLHSRSKS